MNITTSITMKKYLTILPNLLFTLLLFQSSHVLALALSDELIQKNIENSIANSKDLADTHIKVQVEEKLVVLSGEVRLYEQKLISERIAWKATDIFEVDNEIQVVPKHPLTDEAIELKIRGIIKEYKRFHSSSIVIKVDKGVVSVHGSFPEINGPAFLKHKIATIEGVIDLTIHARFLARPKRVGNMQG